MDIFTCKECGILFRRCGTCNKPFPIKLIGVHKKRRYCSKRCARIANWKDPKVGAALLLARKTTNAQRVPVGSRTKTYSPCWKKWYWKVKCEDGRWRYEHRVVMEKIIGRKLRTEEHVHHKNEDSLDNAPDNLQVMLIGDHIRLHHKGIKNPLKASR